MHFFAVFFSIRFEWDESQREREGAKIGLRVCLLIITSLCFCNTPCSALLFLPASSSSPSLDTASAKARNKDMMICRSAVSLPITHQFLGLHKRLKSEKRRVIEFSQHTFRTAEIRWPFLLLHFFYTERQVASSIAKKALMFAPYLYILMYPFLSEGWCKRELKFACCSQLADRLGSR